MGAIKFDSILPVIFHNWGHYGTECLDVHIAGVDPDVVRHLCRCGGEGMFREVCDMFRNHQVVKVVEEMMRLVKKYDFPGPIGCILTVFSDGPNDCIIRAFTYNGLGNMEPLVNEFNGFVEIMEAANA